MPSNDIIHTTLYNGVSCICFTSTDFVIYSQSYLNSNMSKDEIQMYVDMLCSQCCMTEISERVSRAGYNTGIMGSHSIDFDITSIMSL